MRSKYLKCLSRHLANGVPCNVLSYVQLRVIFRLHRRRDSNLHHRLRHGKPIHVRLSHTSSRHPEVQVSILYGGDAWLMQAVTLVRVLMEDSFMNTSFHTRLPCGITSVAQPVKALRYRSDERAPAPHLHHLHGLDWLCSVMSIPPGGDAERAGGRRQRGTHRLRASCTVGTEEVVGTAWATPAERAFPLSHVCSFKTERV